ncbi:acyl-CoA carboxylase subunit beta [Chloroflexota bacterium]
MKMEEELKLLEEMEKQALLPYGEERVEKHHAQGKLTARERVNMLFDKGTFVEAHMYAQHQCNEFGMGKYRPFGDGIITGFGEVNGRLVYAYAMDSIVYGGAQGNTARAKMERLMADAREAKVPLVGLWDGGGGRIQEGSSHGFDHRFAQNIKSSGVIPQISVIMGNCAGGAVYSPALTDFIIMIEGTSSMFITGPRVLKSVTGQDISMEDLGGPKAQSEIAGNCDLVAKNDTDALETTKKLLSLLPSSYLEKPPVVDTGDDPNRIDETLLDVVPENPKRPFDMHQIIYKIIDNGDFFELKPNFARNMITGIARLGGYTVGIIANNPIVSAGAIDCDASDKAGRFYRTCDCFNIPIISLVDTPGYLPGVSEEHKGIIRHGAKMLFGYVEATVPKISVIIRKAYGGSYTAMGTKTMGADFVFAWPTAEIALMGAAGAVAILYRKEIEAAEDKEAVRNQKIEEYRNKFNTPYYGASLMIADVVIKPQETRMYLARTIRLLKDKKKDFPDKKHGNIPL